MQPQQVAGLQWGVRLAQAVARVPRWALYPAGAQLCSPRGLRPDPLGLCAQGPTQARQSLRGEGALVPPFSLLLPRHHKAQVNSWLPGPLSEGVAAQCLCFGQVPSFAVFLVGCRQPGRACSALFRNRVRRLGGSWWVPRAPRSP